MKTKIITAIYDNLFGSDLGGRINRGGHYRYSLRSLLKMTDADFVCYTSEEEIEDLKHFFYVDNNVSSEKLILKTLKVELKSLKPAGDKKTGKATKKPKLDATGVINIDEYIYKQSIEKMKKILILYQLMQEVAVDCLVLNDFHKNGNKTIQCHNF
jgi:hypothetical protein